MVERFLRILHREWSGLHEAAFLLAAFAFLSQVLALVRDRLLAHHFGAGESLDIYYAAFRIPDFLYASIASFVAVTVLIPFLLERMDEGEHNKRAHAFLNSVFTVFVGVMVVVIAVLFVVMPYLAHIVVPGFQGTEKSQFVLLSRILLLSPFFLGISNLFGSITQTFKRFTVFALGPVLYNIGIIIGILCFLPTLGLPGLVFGVLLGALLHMAIQIPVLQTANFFPRFTKVIEWKDVGKLTALSLPRTLALSATHFVTIILIAIASHINTGAIAIFTLALNLQSIPLAIVGTSYSVAAFPTLAKLWNGKQHGEFLEHITTAVRHIMFWSFPSIMLFIVLRAQIVRTILGSGLFDWTATRLTAAALALFALSVAAQSLQLLFLRSFYAMGDTKIPLRNMLIGAITIGCTAIGFREMFATNGIFRYFIETILRVDQLPGTEVLMLPLAYSIGITVSLLVFIRDLRKRFPDLLVLVKSSFLHTFTSSVVMGVVAYHSLQFFDDIFDVDTFIGIFLQGACSGIVGIVVGVFLLKLMGNKEIDEIWRSLHARIWKAKPIATEQESL